MWDKKESALDIARGIKQKERTEKKKAELKAKQEAAAVLKHKKSLETKIKKTFGEFKKLKGWTIETTNAITGGTAWVLSKKGKRIVEAYVGWGSWDNPNYDYKVTESGDVIYWTIDGHKTFSEGWYFEESFGQAMAKHI